MGLFDILFGNKRTLDSMMYDLLAKAGLIDTIKYEYDDDGNVKKEEYYKNEVLLFTIQYTYDSSNRIIKMVRVGK